MSPVSAIVVFVIIWWLVLFMVLPFGVQRDDTPEEGHDPGAPRKPMILRKMLITTGIALVLFAVYGVIVEYDLITLRPGG